MNELFSPAAEEHEDNNLSPDFLAAIRARLENASTSGDLTEKIAGRSEVYCRLDTANREVMEVASVATQHRGYESLLPGRELGQVGRVSSLASGICGGVHATASALCLEMAIGCPPPPLGIVLRNLLLSCQYFNDNVMHLFVLAGPDYSREVVERTSPLLWDKARQGMASGYKLHGFRTVGDILEGLSKGQGNLYREALQMAAQARQAYSLLGGKYPHSESIVPGGVTLSVDGSKLEAFGKAVEPFASYSRRAAAIWNDVFDFFLSEEPGYAELGRSDATLMDFGQWDHPEHYDASYRNCDDWGARRWSSPGIVVDGQLQCSAFSTLNAGLEEGSAHSFQRTDSLSAPQKLDADPSGNSLGDAHPWNRRVGRPEEACGTEAYSWGSSLTWQNQGFEVGAYARLYITAKCKQASGRYFAAQSNGLEFDVPGESQTSALRWCVPAVWNAFERNRARAHVLAFNMAVTMENLELAKGFIRSGETECRTILANIPSGKQLGVGLWGASRGFLAHWAVIDDGRINAYRISIPSRVNIGTRSDAGALGPLESALTGSPLIATDGGSEGVSYIDIQRTIQSFDPCMSCAAYILPGEVAPGSESFIKREIDTAFPA